MAINPIAIITPEEEVTDFPPNPSNEGSPNR